MTRPYLSTLRLPYLAEKVSYLPGPWHRSWLVASVAAVGLVGCGPVKPPGETVHLAGTVRIAGKPLPPACEANMRFMPIQPGQAPPSSVEIRDGKFDAPRVPKGPITVVFNITRLTGKMVVEDNAPGGTPYPEREDLVPPSLRPGIPHQAERDNLKLEFDLR